MTILLPPSTRYRNVHISKYEQIDSLGLIYWDLSNPQTTKIIIHFKGRSEIHETIHWLYNTSEVNK